MSKIHYIQFKQLFELLNRYEALANAPETNRQDLLSVIDAIDARINPCSKDPNEHGINTMRIIEEFYHGTSVYNDMKAAFSADSSPESTREVIDKLFEEENAYSSFKNEAKIIHDILHLQEQTQLHLYFVLTLKYGARGLAVLSELNPNLAASLARKEAQKEAKFDEVIKDQNEDTVSGSMNLLCKEYGDEVIDELSAYNHAKKALEQCTPKLVITFSRIQAQKVVWFNQIRKAETPNEIDTLMNGLCKQFGEQSLDELMAYNEKLNSQEKKLIGSYKKNSFN